jgi:ELL-associated factor
MNQVGAFPVELGREYEIKLGSSFSKTSKSSVHTFESSALECSDPANVNVEENGHVCVTLPTGQGNSTTYRGPKRPCPKKCILIIDRDTGEVTLERVTSTMQLKRVRTPTAKRAITTLNKIVSDKPNDKGRISPLPARVSTAVASKAKPQESPLVIASLPATVPASAPISAPSNLAPTSTTTLQLSDSSSDDGSSSSSSDDSSDSEEEPQAMVTTEQSQTAQEENPFTEQLKADLLMSESDSGDSSSDSDG